MTPSEVAAAGSQHLSPLELAAGFVMDERVPAGRLARTSATPREVLESVVLESLVPGRPCYVAFSGGRDSSAVLAVADHVARREGLPRPVPVIERVVGSAEADESDWQALVLGHLGLTDPVVVHVNAEDDLLGPRASGLLARAGLVWPANAYILSDLARSAAGGSLLTGVGGDEVLGDSVGAPAALVLARRRRPDRASVRSILGGTFAPDAWRARQKTTVPRLPWLTAAGHEQFASAMVAGSVPVHRGWARGLAAFGAGRYARCIRSSLALVAGEDVATSHPLMDPRFLAACASRGGRTGLGGRTAAMRMLVGDLLPAALVERTTKAHFGAAIWQEPSGAFRRSPAAVATVAADPALAGIVDPDALAAAWRQDQPHYQSALLFQASWLAHAAREAGS